MIGAGLAVVLSAGTAGYLIGEPGEDAVPTAADAPAATSNTTTTSAVVETTPPGPEDQPEPTTAESAPPSGVLSEPSGLFCRDLEAEGYTYAEAVTYWEHHGRSSQMDASGIGIPCSTVYPRSDVETHWGTDVLVRACPSAGALLTAFLDVHPDNAPYIAGLMDIRCNGSWAIASIQPSVPSDPGAAIFIIEDGAPRLVTYGTGMEPESCVDEFGMPADVASQFCA